MLFTQTIALALLSGLATAASSKITLKTSKTSATCPPYSIGTVTATVTSTKTVTPKPVPVYTETSTIFPPQRTTTQYYNLTSTLQTYTTSTFTAYTFSVFKVTSPPAPTTVYKPTKSGFTPLLCEPEYFRNTVTKTSVTTQTFTSTKTVTSSYTASIDPATSFVASSTTYITDTYLYTTYAGVYATSTSTITRIDATQTVYAACESNNVAPNYPGGSYIRYLQGGKDGYMSDSVFSVDAVDCCGICQGNSSCVASYYLEALNVVSCQLFYKSSTAPKTCNPAYRGGANALAIDSTGYGLASNGACGQIGFDA